MPISSYIVECAKGTCMEVAQRLTATPGLEVAGVKDDQIALVSETSTRQQERALTESLSHIPGILTLTPVFCHVGEDHLAFDLPGCKGGESNAPTAMEV